MTIDARTSSHFPICGPLTRTGSLAWTGPSAEVERTAGRFCAHGPLRRSAHGKKRVWSFSPKKPRGERGVGASFGRKRGKRGGKMSPHLPY